MKDPEEAFWKRRPRKNPELVRRDIAGDALLVPVRGDLARLHRLFVLDPVGAFIWERLDGETSLEEIRSRLLEHFEVELEPASADLAEYVAELDEGGVWVDGQDG